MHGVWDTKSEPGIFLTALEPGLAAPCLVLQHVRWGRQLCWEHIQHCRESQMLANGVCRASSMSYKALSNCLVGSNAQERGEAILGSSPATPKNSLSCRLPAHAHSADHSSQTLFWLTLQAPALVWETRSVQDFWGPGPFCQYEKFTSMLGKSEQRTLCVSDESAKQGVCLLFSSSFH